MGVKEVRNVLGYSNIQLKNKINKLKMKYDKLTGDEQQELEVLKKEAWKRGMDEII